MDLKRSVIFQRKRRVNGRITGDKIRRHSGISEKSSGDKDPTATESLNKLMKASERVILDIKAVFPFNFFPDEVVIDETKVSIHSYYFFNTKQVKSFEYKDIFNVSIQQNVLFFARLEIIDRFFHNEPVSVDFLKKKDAMLARRIIQGLIIAKKENIALQELSVEDLRYKLERIGMSR